MQGYTMREVERARLAQKIQGMLGFPSNQDFKKMVEGNQLVNCPITTKDIINAENIFGRNVGCLKGKTTRKKPEAVATDYMSAPEDIFKGNKNMTLSMDIMYVFGLAFFVMISRRLKFITVELIEDRKTTNLEKCVSNVFQLYKNAGLNVETVLMDMEGESLQPKIVELGAKLNTNMFLRLNAQLEL
jgi:hypothetical protein